MFKRNVHDNFDGLTFNTSEKFISHVSLLALLQLLSILTVFKLVCWPDSIAATLLAR